MEQHLSLLQHSLVTKCLLMYNSDAVIPVTANIIISVDIIFINIQYIYKLFFIYVNPKS